MPPRPQPAAAAGRRRAPRTERSKPAGVPWALPRASDNAAASAARSRRRTPPPGVTPRVIDASDRPREPRSSRDSDRPTPGGPLGADLAALNFRPDAR